MKISKFYTMPLAVLLAAINTEFGYLSKEFKL